MTHTSPSYRRLFQAGLALALLCILGGATPAFAARSQGNRRPGDHAKLDRKLNEDRRKAGFSYPLPSMPNPPNCS